MPTTQILVPPTAEAEPVTLALANAALRLDLDLESTDLAIIGQISYLQLLIRAAREKVQAYTGRLYGAQTVEITYTLDEAYALPSGATATEVTGFYTTLEALADASSYLEEYRKGISIERRLDWPYPALAQTYTVTATTTGDQQFANLATTVMLKLVAEWWKNREMGELPVGLRVDLQPAMINPLGG